MFHIRVKNTTVSITIRKVTISMVHCSDIPKVVDYLMQHYFSAAPLLKYMQLTESPEVLEFLRKFCADILSQNISLVATASDGEIAGVCCNMISRKNENFDFGTHSDVKKIGDFLTYVSNECDIFERYPGLEEYMHITFLFVHEDHRKQELTKRLVDRTRELALKLGLKIMRVNCCSLQAARAAQRKGWTCLKEVEYEQYKVDGEQVFYPDEPSATFGACIMKVEHPSFLKSST